MFTSDWNRRRLLSLLSRSDRELRVGGIAKTQEGEAALLAGVIICWGGLRSVDNRCEALMEGRMVFSLFVDRVGVAGFRGVRCNSRGRAGLTRLGRVARR